MRRRTLLSLALYAAGGSGGAPAVPKKILEILQKPSDAIDRASFVGTGLIHTPPEEDSQDALFFCQKPTAAAVGGRHRHVLRQSLHQSHDRPGADGGAAARSGRYRHRR